MEFFSTSFDPYQDLDNAPFALFWYLPQHPIIPIDHKRFVYTKPSQYTTQQQQQSYPSTAYHNQYTPQQQYTYPPTVPQQIYTQHYPNSYPSIAYNGYIPPYVQRYIPTAHNIQGKTPQGESPTSNHLNSAWHPMRTLHRQVDLAIWTVKHSGIRVTSRVCISRNKNCL